MSNNNTKFEDLPLSSTNLTMNEKAKWLLVLDPLLAYAGSPGDWGYNSKLGALIIRLHEVRDEIYTSPVDPE